MYREWRSQVDGAVVWTQDPMPAGEGRVLPDGCIDLLLWDGALLVAGPDTRAHLFPRAAGSRMTGLRLPPGAGPLVLGVPAHELRDRRVPLCDLWPSAAVRVLEERAGEAPEKGRVLEGVAGARLAGRGSPTGRAAGLLARGRSVAAVADDLGLSERQLHRRCLDAFGYGPKTLARVLRRQGALRRAARGMPPAQVAAAAGYADQAHLSREVRALAGVPLRELLPQGSRANRSTPLPSGSATTA